MSNPSEPTPPVVTAAEVSAEIGALLKGTPDLSRGVALPITETDLGIGAPPAPAPAEEIAKIPMDPMFSPDLKTQGNVATAVSKAEAFQFRPEDIALTEREREVFLKALLTDTPVVLTLTLPGLSQMPFTLQTRTNVEQHTIFAALEADERDKRLTGTTDWLQWLQYYGAAFQVLRVGPRTFTPPSVDTTTKPEVAQAALRAYVETNFMAMSVMKWHLMVNALRLFDAKTNLASNELLTRDFSQPAG
jgi:hypothetical protein